MGGQDEDKEKVRSVNECDFAKALKKVKKTGESARMFQKKDCERRNATGDNNDTSGYSFQEIARGIEMLQRLMATDASRQSQNNDISSDLHFDEEKIPEL